jgi:threonine/homoserine/homoserine lactone efflux protein
VDFDVWLGLAGFVMIGAITPGPNNTLLMASSLNSGFAKTLPFLAGIQSGFALMFLMLSLGLGQLFDLFPLLKEGLKYAGAAFLVWFAWKIATSPIASSSSESKTLNFLEGTAFQFLNPKAWIMCLSAVSVYMPEETGAQVIAIGIATWVVVGIPCNVAWMLGGRALSSITQRPKTARAINILLALLLLLSIAPVVA